MITVKKLIKTASTLLLTVFLLNSCMSNNDEELPFVPVDPSETEDTVSEYRLVISESASAYLSNAVNDLRERIEEKTATSTSVCTDSYAVIKDGRTWDILVGYTDLDVSRQAMKNMRRDDYTCRSYDGYTIIGGKSDNATLVAIERFAAEILPVSDGSCLIPKDGGFDFVGNYAVEGLTLLSADASAYSVFCDRDDPAEINIASDFIQTLSDRTGYIPELVHTNTHDRQIVFEIDKGCEADIAYISASERGVTLRANSAFGLRAATERLLELICPDGCTGRLSPELPEEIAVPYSCPNISLASLCLGGLLPIDSPSEITDIVSAINENSPDLMLLGELEDTDRTRIKNSLSGYGDISAEGGSMILARSDASAELVFFEVSSGLRREGYRIKGDNIDILLLYVTGTADGDITLELPAELSGQGVPTVAVVHTYNGGEVSIGRGENSFFEEAVSELVTVYGDSFGFSCSADSRYISASVSDTDDDCGYRQMLIKKIG